MSDIAIIAAIDRRRAIGYANRLPWSLPDDLRRFKALTIGHSILMGRKTAESIGRVLPGRRNLVLTRSGSSPVAGMDVVGSLDAALDASDGGLFVIGGGEVYALSLARATRMYLTHVDTSLLQADAWFPQSDPGDWHEVARAHHAADERHVHAFDFVDYVRQDHR